tara:strand:- start:597 stop:1322 length:726 start_codon:yes stop_codon:yes gene_type:complete
MKALLSLIGIELSPVSHKEKLVSLVGGVLSISILVWITRQAVGPVDATLIIASMGASAVLLFAVPHGQLSQPWPVLAGHGISATIGVLCSHHLGDTWLAAGCAVGLSIGAMHQLKCIHPPGGATALTAVLGGQAIQEMGLAFVLCPVMANALIMVGIAVVFNLPFAWRRYPVGLAKGRRPLKPHPFGREIQHEDIVKALRTLDLFIDVAEPDLLALARTIAREREARIIRETRQKTAPHET